MVKLRLFLLLNIFCLFANAQENVPASIYDFKIPAHQGEAIDLSQYRGREILMVNVTAQDDRNREYAQLEELYQKHKDKLVIIGFLTEDFLTEPGSKKNKPLTFRTYEVTFPLAAKIKVREPEMAPVYRWLTQKKYNKFMDTEVKWDFQKYLINEKGELTAVFDPKVTASDPKLIAAIEQ